VIMNMNGKRKEGFGGGIDFWSSRVGGSGVACAWGRVNKDKKSQHPRRREFLGACR